MGSLLRLADSDSVYSNELDIFTIPATNASVNKMVMVEHQPKGILDENNPLEFLVTGSGSDYISLNKSRLLLRAKIVNGDGTDLAEGESVAPVNLSMHSFFKQLDVTFNGRSVSCPNAHYAYRSYIDVLTSYGREEKEGKLRSELYYKDTPGKMDECRTNVEPDSGFKLRKDIAAESNEFEMEGPIYADIFRQKRYLLNGVEMKLKFTQSADKFRIHGADETKGFKVVITYARLKLCHVAVTPNITVAHTATLKADNPAIYPYMKTEIKAMPIGLTTYVSFDDIFTGKIPQRLICFIVNSNAYTGNYELNPFTLYHLNMSSMGVRINGELYNYREMEMNFADEKYLSVYNEMLNGLRKWTGKEDIFISREDYPEGYTFWVFDLEYDSASDYVFPMIRQGNLSIDLSFRSEPATQYLFVVYGMFRSMLGIDKARNVLEVGIKP